LFCEHGIVSVPKGPILSTARIGGVLEVGTTEKVSFKEFEVHPFDIRQYSRRVIGG
jgi:hypothetical protein